MAKNAPIILLYFWLRSNSFEKLGWNDILADHLDIDAFVSELSDDLHILLAGLRGFLCRDQLVVALLLHGRRALPPVGGGLFKRDSL